MFFFICNGALAGLVAITAPCAYIAPWAAAVIGLFSGLAMRGAVWLVECKFKIDDPLGAVAVHAANGIWGMLAVGIFADGTYQAVTGLIMGSGWQLLAQFIGTVVAMGWAFAWGATIFYTLRATMGIRVSALVKSDGIDTHIHGSPCYPVEQEIFAALTGAAAIDLKQEKEQISLLEEALSKDRGREKIYSDKLGRWVYARLKDTKKR